jgi:hypothetical protein
VLAACGTYATATACGGADPRARERVAERDQLRREVAGYRAMEADTAAAVSHPEQDVVVSVGDSLLRALLGAALPVRARLRGSTTVTLTRVAVALRGNVARVDVTGEVQRASAPRIAAPVWLRGALHGFAVDSARVLRARLSVDDVEVGPPSGVPGALRPFALALLQGVVERGLPEITPQLPAVAIPVRLERAVRLPGFGPDGYVRIAPVSAPLAVHVARVAAVRDRLWITLHVDRGAFASARSDAP